MAIDLVDTGTLAALVGGIITYVLRERNKHKNVKANNGDLKEIKDTTNANQESLTKLDKDVGIIGTDLSNMRLHCSETVARFAKEVGENRTDIKDILKDKT